MPDAITLRLDDREFRRILKRLGEREIPRWAARTINKCAFEVIDAEKEHAGEVFSFAGSQTKLFMSGRGAFRFDKATPEKPEATVYPNPGPGGRRATIFETQEEGGLFRAEDPGRIAVAGKVGVPVLKSRGRSPAGLRRTARGQLRRISRREAVSFRVGNVILEREGREQWGGGSSRAGSRTGTRLSKPKVRILFALKEAVRITPRFEFYRVARDTVRRVLPEKARREFQRIRGAR